MKIKNSKMLVLTLTLANLSIGILVNAQPFLKKHPAINPYNYARIAHHVEFSFSWVWDTVASTCASQSIVFIFLNARLASSEKSFSTP